MDHRSYGETKNCKGCRFWSEMLAMSQGSAVVAVCLSEDSPNKTKYTPGYTTCDGWKSGHFGSVDDPPDYGAENRAAYEAEERGETPSFYDDEAAF